MADTSDSYVSWGSVHEKYEQQKSNTLNKRKENCTAAAEAVEVNVRTQCE